MPFGIGDFILPTDALMKSLDAVQHLKRRGSEFRSNRVRRKTPDPLNEKDFRL
jgi:hypothetical protein